MSRVIENDHPWDESEIQYKLDRNLVSEVDRNRRDFPPVPVKDVTPEDSPTLNLHPEVFEYVKNLDVENLKSELSKRDLSTAGEEKELKVRLAQALQKEKDASNA